MIASDFSFGELCGDVLEGGGQRRASADGQSPSFLYLNRNNSIEERNPQSERGKSAFPVKIGNVTDEFKAWVAENLPILGPWMPDSYTRLKPTGSERLDDFDPSKNKAYKKVESAMFLNADAMLKWYGEKHLLFITLTFPDNVEDNEEASRRYNSLRTNILKDRYFCGVTVVERQRRGAWHYHLIVAAKQDMKSPGLHTLIDEQAFWRETACKFGFGRVNVQPAKKNGKAAITYMSKYIAKHLTARQARDKGVRLVRYFGFAGAYFGPEATKANSAFTFISEGSRKWRQRVGTFAAENGCADFEQLQEKFGRYWARVLLTQIEWEKFGQRGCDIKLVTTEQRWK